jgi:hypothetical protein
LGIVLFLPPGDFDAFSPRFSLSIFRADPVAFDLRFVAISSHPFGISFSTI